MKKSAVAGCLSVLLALSGGAQAGKVNLPREGSYEFEFCVVGHGRSFSSGSDFFVMSYDLDANLRTSPPGRPFDRMGARCYGLYTNMNGKQAETGVCEMTDLDGDKWWMDYHGNPDGAGGTYVAAKGTGKYEGVTIKGEYRIDNNWGNGSADVAFRGCNPNKGFYKLK